MENNSAVHKSTVAVKGKTLDMTLCAAMASLIAVGAFIRIDIPVEPFAMHFTLQWFFVLAAGLLLGKKRGAVSVCVYLLIGLMGIPVFASGGGPMYLVKPTFGFLLGFSLAAYAMGLVVGLRKNPTFWWMLLASSVGLVLYYGMGILYFYVISNFVLGMPVGWGLVLANSLITFWEDFALCVLAVALCQRLRPALRKILPID